MLLLSLPKDHTAVCRFIEKEAAETYCEEEEAEHEWHMMPAPAAARSLPFSARGKITPSRPIPAKTISNSELSACMFTFLPPLVIIITPSLAEKGTKIQKGLTHIGLFLNP